MLERKDGLYQLGELGEPQKENIFEGTVAGLFPGQGSQGAGMGFDLYQHSEAARRVFDEADNALGFNFSELIFTGSEGELRDTVNSQPAIMTVSMASFRALKEALGDQMPPLRAVTGHSLGLYTSAVAAGVINFRDGVQLVRERGRLMKEASEKQPGEMAAIIGLDESILEEICLETGVDIANVNSNEQIIISGDRLAIARTRDFAHQRGARKTDLLPVSGAFHSRLMRPAQQGLRQAISGIDFKDPQVPIVANSRGLVLTTADDVRRELVRTLCGTVRWKDAVELMAKSGVTDFFEFGHGRILSTLLRQINRDFKTFSINSPDSIQKFASEMGL